MTAHKHASMIKTKADNMELVVYCKDSYDNTNIWQETSQLPIQEEFDYFLCLPQHKEACLHWLNGGDIEYKNELASSGWVAVSSIKESIEEDMEEGEELWSERVYFMRTDTPIRIKPRKEKRWIGYCANTNQTFPHPQTTKDVAEDYAARNYGYEISKWQFIEIEVEV